MNPEDVVGKSVIAKRLDLGLSTIHSWAGRDDWPEPRGYFGTVTSGPGSQPFWSWTDDIEPFLERNPSLGKR